MILVACDFTYLSSNSSQHLASVTARHVKIIFTSPYHPTKLPFFTSVQFFLV